MSTEKKFGYIRVSTSSQADNSSFEVQTEELLKAGVPKFNIIREVGSGTKKDRPELMKLLALLEEGNELYVWRLDRFSRSLFDSIQMIALLKEKKVKFIALDLPFSDNESFQHVILTLFAYLAEKETENRRIRQAEGIKRAQAANKYLGRKSVLTKEKLEEIRKYHFEKKLNKTEIAKLCSLSRGTVYKALDQLKNGKNLLQQKT